MNLDKDSCVSLCVCVFLKISATYTEKSPFLNTNDVQMEDRGNANA